MKRHLVYDLPTRVFHWLFAVFFLTSFIIVKTVDDESPNYVFHMLSGLMLSFAVILRIIWGVLGTQHARFTGFVLNPLELVNYFKGLLTGDKRRWSGHNPASSWAAIIMMLLALGLGLTGYLMTSGGDKESFEDIHELFANSFIIVVVLHVAGIILHTLRHKEAIALSMVDGKKELKEESVNSDGIKSTSSSVGILFLGLITAFALYLAKNYDSQTRSLNLFGTTLQLGESETGTHKTHSSEKHSHEEKEDD